MPSRQERKLAEFVNREDEMSDFVRMLDKDDKRIMVLNGGGGLGKSSLVARMMHECATRGSYKAEVVSTDTRNKHYLEIMRKLREDIGQVVGMEFFSPFTDLINYYTEPHYELKVDVSGLQQAKISVADGASVNQSNTGDIGGIIIKDLMLTTPRDDLAVPESERMAQITDSFHQCLDEATRNTRWVIFLDATEKLAEGTNQWLWSELLSPVLDDELKNVCFVISGRNQPELDRDWSFVVEMETLNPLGFQHVSKYLEKRGLPSKGNEMVVDAILAATGGIPDDVANMVDGILARQRARASA